MGLSYSLAIHIYRNITLYFGTSGRGGGGQDKRKRRYLALPPPHHKVGVIEFLKIIDLFFTIIKDLIILKMFNFNSYWQIKIHDRSRLERIQTYTWIHDLVENLKHLFKSNIFFQTLWRHFIFYKVCNISQGLDKVYARFCQSFSRFRLYSRFRQSLLKV